MPRFPNDAAGLGGRSPTSPDDTFAIWYVRIVVLSSEDDAWCELCGLPSATTVTYVLEPAGHAPSGLFRLTYCETCEGA
jgi:hypothetical protein